MALGKEINVMSIAAVVGALISQGCSSMLPHLQFSDAQVTNQATWVAATEACLQRGYMDANTAHAFISVAREQLKVSVYNKPLFDSSYNRIRADADRYSADEFRQICADMQQKLPSATAAMYSQLQATHQARAQAINELSQSLASFGSTNYGAGFSSIPMPTEQPTFGQQGLGGNTQHYRVNTGSGQRHCFATASGYVHCQ